MYIEWAVTCRFAESDGLTANVLGAGTDVLLVQSVPGAVSTFVAVRLAAPADELEPGESHSLLARVLAPTGAPVVGPEGEPSPPLETQIGSTAPVQQLVPGWLVNPLATFGLQWWVVEAGSYTVEISVDGGEPHRCPVHVLEARDVPNQS